MKIIKIEKGYVKVIPEDEEDLLFLYFILDENSKISGYTLRTKKIKREGGFEKGEKEKVWLKIRCEKKKIEGKKLRVLGIIEEGVDIGKHHSFEIRVNDKIEIEKNFSEFEIDRLRKLKHKVKPENILFCLVDEEQAVLGIIRDSAKILKKIFRKKKREEKNLEEFYKEVCTEIKKMKEEYNIEKIIVAGPGFAKEDIAKMLDFKCYIDSVSYANENGLKELLKREVIKKIGKEVREAKELKKVEEFFEHLAKEDGKAIYGKENIESNLERIKELLVCDSKLEEYKEIIEKGFKKNVEIVVINSEKEYGKRILSMKGIVGIAWY